MFSIKVELDLNVPAVDAVPSFPQKTGLSFRTLVTAEKGWPGTKKFDNAIFGCSAGQRCGDRVFELDRIELMVVFR